MSAEFTQVLLKSGEFRSLATHIKKNKGFFSALFGRRRRLNGDSIVPGRASNPFEKLIQDIEDEGHKFN